MGNETWKFEVVIKGKKVEFQFVQLPIAWALEAEQAGMHDATRVYLTTGVLCSCGNQIITEDSATTVINESIPCA